MGASAPQVFKGITPEQYGRLAAKAKAAGIALAGNNGSASKFGVEISWNYSPEAEELILQTLKTPFFMSAADIDSKVKSLVHDSVGQA